MIEIIFPLIIIVFVGLFLFAVTLPVIAFIFDYLGELFDKYVYWVWEKRDAIKKRIPRKVKVFFYTDPNKVFPQCPTCDHVMIQDLRNDKCPMCDQK